MTTQAPVSDDYTCEPCNVRCSTERAYKNHTRSNKHRETVGLPLQQHPCPRCQKLYSRRSEVKRHLEDGKCSGSRRPFSTEASNATKHGLSVSPAGGVWKSQRTRSPTGEPLPGVPDARRDSAHTEVEAYHLDQQAFRSSTTEIVSSTATLGNGQVISGSYLPLVEASSPSVHDHGSPIVNTPQADVTRQSAKSLLSWISKRQAMPREQQAMAVASATPTTVAKEIAKNKNALDLVALAESLDTMSFEEFKKRQSKSSQSMSEPRSIAQRASPRSFSALSLDPSLANPDSLSGLFGLQGANTRTSTRADGVVRSRPQKRMPHRFVGEHLLIDQNKGQDCVESAAKGHYQEVYNILFHNHEQIEYSNENLWCVQTAITAATANGHFTDRDIILDVLRHPNFFPDLRLELDDFIGPRMWAVGRKVKGYLEALRRFLRELVGIMCCLCPRELRVGTVCEKVASRQSSDKEATRSECQWGDKLRQRSWPSLSGLIEVATLEQEREFLLSVGLPLYLVRPNEKERLRAHEERLSSS